MSISLLNVSAEFSSTFGLHEINWSIEKGQHWVLVGHNGAGKSALAALLAGYGELQDGALTSDFKRIELVSYESQQALIEKEREKDSADILDVIAVPTKVHELLCAADGSGCSSLQSPLCLRLIELFKFNGLLSRDFVALSTGETRKLLLIKALLAKPDLLILDEPFDGLDADMQLRLRQLLDELSVDITLVFVLNCWSEIPQFVSHYALVSRGELQATISAKDTSAVGDLSRLLSLQQSNFVLPEADSDVTRNSFVPGDTIASLNKVAINYPQGAIIEDLSWQIKLGQHWQLSGPNGSGKTCLLQLISGDHPQCYINDIFVFGFKRGSGESIWDIKKHIGFLSNAFHLSYRVNCSLVHVVLSGFYDSIGLYQQPTKKQIQLAQQWLGVIGLADHEATPFQQLSFGDQRLALIVRAMVKHPPLLILDEPCNGLDEINRQRILAVIETIAKSTSTSVIYVNHHSDDVIDGITNHILLDGDSPDCEVRYACSDA
ncbi:ABC transporter related protein [Paraglaciecola sp. T6c]|uniref:molybdate ABC transporter ATP-binding protein ModF n=1 Tax=Pseudoalteromonas atlantica (strain T6c / ATCC BAA-1087) TaxID=3042615 RepID=UPI00005C5F5E|nr:molybdate ABC transporter ATP-binding protein ModF [Paraglaciecola sp. T6c]ABG40564.1 ABC transporter related protein [Paraglaciecola sp. T6c]